MQRKPIQHTIDTIEEEENENITGRTAVSNISEVVSETYSDAFEEYEDDFEEYDENEDDGFKEEKVESIEKNLVFTELKVQHDSILLKRMSKPRILETKLSNPTSSYERPSTSASRTFQITTNSSVNTEKMLESLEIYNNLRNSGVLEVIQPNVISIPPNRMADMYNKIVTQGVKAQVKNSVISTLL